MSPRSRAPRLLLASLLTAVGALALAAAPASAAGHIVTASFGAAASTPADPYPLSNPTDTAVDNSTGTSAHDIYVTDPGNFRVEKFDSSGNFILMFGQDVDLTTGADVCTAASGDTCQAGVSGSLPGAFTTPTFVAVDGSSGPSAGDVYVGDTGDNTVSKFDSSGNLITGWGSGGQLNGSTAKDGPFGPLAGIAIDTSGNLFAFDENNNFFKFKQDGSFTTDFNSGPTGYGIDPAGIAVDGASNLYYEMGYPDVEQITPGGGYLFGFPGIVDGDGDATGLVVDPSNNDLYVDQGGGAISRFTCGAGCASAESFSSPNLNGAQGIAIDAATHVIYIANTGGGNVLVAPGVGKAQVTTGTTSSAGQSTATATTATLTGQADPAGGANITSCEVLFGTSTTYGQSVPCSPAPPYTGPTDVTAEFTGLQTETTYHYNILVTTAEGVNTGQDQTITTIPSLPLVDETSSSAVTEDTATLNAQINPSLAPTIYRFQYGPTTSYGSRTYPSESIGSDDVDHPVSVEISALTPATTYHYRAVATNLAGNTYGPDRTFTTPAHPGIAVSSVSDIGQTTATLGASILPGFRDTTYHFEYGRTSTYGSNTPESASIGSDNTAHPAAALLTGLVPETTYHYRVVATNAIGASAGPDQIFTTASPPLLAPPPTTHCKKGLVKRNGKCVKLHRHHNPKHHGRSH